MPRAAETSDAEFRRLCIMVDYLFGKGVSRALPRKGFRLAYSRKSGRVKLVFHQGELFATVRPNGSMALSMRGAIILARRAAFRVNYVTVKDDAVPFVRGGKSVYCKFVTGAGKNVTPRGDAVVVDGKGKVLGVGGAVMHGKFMRQFKSGVAVKVREGIAT